ncbi:MAG: hypothetical protein J7M19_05495 [Planctomycetes bacterium]|nr:hypothetical protein [Planctomycetota bacterium]
MSRTLLMTEDCRRFLQDAGVETLRELARLSSVVTVASSRSTRTVRVEAGGRALYVKDYQYATWKRRFRIFFRGGLFGRSRARREWDALAVLSRIGVEGPEAAALVENRRAGFLTGAIVATFEVEGTETLDDVLAREGFLTGTRFVPPARALGRWVRKMHEAGYFDGNLHFRNILTRKSDPVRFYKIDSPRGRCARMPFVREILRTRDLATLALEGRGWVSPKLCLAFLKAYSDEPWEGGRRILAERVLAASFALEREYPRRAPSCTGPGRDGLPADTASRRPSSGCLQGHPAKRGLLGRIRPAGALVRERLDIRREYAGILEDAGLADFDGVWAFCEGREVTRHRDRSVVEIELTRAGRTRRFYLKRLSRVHIKHLIEEALAFEWPLSKCRREWESAEALSGAGVSAAPMAAMGERRLGPFPLESFLVVEAAYGAETLDVFLAGPAAPRTHRKRTAFIAALSHSLARMHSAGLFHRDLYAKHIFVRREGGKSVINIIDLQRMHRGGGRRHLVADLAALNVTLPWRVVSAADRLRFLHKYVRARWGDAPGGFTRRLARDILKRCAHIAGRKKFRSIEWRRAEGK